MSGYKIGKKDMRLLSRNQKKIHILCEFMVRWEIENNLVENNAIRRGGAVR